MKKFATTTQTIILAIAMIFALTACSENEAAPAVTPAPTPAATQTPTSTPEPTSALESEEEEIIESFTPIKSVFPTGDRSFAIDADGGLWAWGNNEHGALGDGTTETRLSPVYIMGDVVEIYSKGSSFYAIKNDRSLWAWGNNSESAPLGDGSTEIHLTPVHIMDDVDSIHFPSLSDYDTRFIIKTDRSLWAWGYGYTGYGTIETHLSPVHIIDDVLSYVRDNTINDSHHVIKTDGSLWGWGYNIASNFCNIGNLWRVSPVYIADDVIDVKPGIHDLFVIRSDRSLWEIGLSSNSADLVLIMENVTEVVTRGALNYAIKTDGSLWGWGINSESAPLGDGTTENRVSPVRIMDDVDALYGTFVKKTDGSLWGWGGTARQPLGDGTAETRISPVHVVDNVDSLRGGMNCLYIIKTDGSLWGWGSTPESAWHSYLGDGTNETRLSPVHIMDNVDSAFGRFVIKTDGSLWGWGNNEHGQVGDGTTELHLSPVQIIIN